MKNLKGITRDCRKVFNILKTLGDEVGAYALLGTFTYSEKLILQCNEKLVSWLEKNNLEFNSEYLNERAYETEDFILFLR